MSIPPGGPTQQITIPLGTSTVSLFMGCINAHPFALFQIQAIGIGQVKSTGVKYIESTASTVPFTDSIEDLIPAPIIVAIGQGSPSHASSYGWYQRAGGTLVFHNDTDVTTVVYDMTLDHRFNTLAACSFRGTAVKGN